MIVSNIPVTLLMIGPVDSIDKIANQEIVLTDKKR